MKPAGIWPENWTDELHEYDGHGVDCKADDYTGEGILNNSINTLYVQNGIQYAEDDVSGVQLDPGLVHAGRAVEMDFFKTMGVYDRVPRPSSERAAGRSFALNGLM